MLAESIIWTSVSQNGGNIISFKQWLPVYSKAFDVLGFEDERLFYFSIDIRIYRYSVSVVLPQTQTIRLCVYLMCLHAEL